MMFGKLYIKKQSIFLEDLKMGIHDKRATQALVS